MPASSMCSMTPMMMARCWCGETASDCCDHSADDGFGDLTGLGDVAGNAVGGLFEVELLEEGAELFAIAGHINRFNRGAKDGDTGVFQVFGEVEGGLAAELDDDAADEVSRRGIRG